MRKRLWLCRLFFPLVLFSIGLSFLQPCRTAVTAAPEVNPLVNPYRGTREREEVFAFAQKPTVVKKGNQWEIRFASQGKCDATVAILDKDGKIVRHLASGVLGDNAPFPFQQGALKQTLTWDGNDDQGKPVPQGCKVWVGLGLKAAFEQNIGYEPTAVPEGWQPGAEGQPPQFVLAEHKGELYILGAPQGSSLVAFQGRVFKDGKYVRTFWPPPADAVEKVAAKFSWKLRQTTWGDLVANMSITRLHSFRSQDRLEAVKTLFELAGVDRTVVQVGPAPRALVLAPLHPVFGGLARDRKMRLAVDRGRDELYFALGGEGLYRIDGHTGVMDKTWFADGSLDAVSEVCIGPGSHIYISTGAHGYGQFIIRLDRDGRPIDFGGDAVPLPRRDIWEGGKGQYGEMEGKKIYGGGVCPKAFKKVEVQALWTGHFGHSNVHERGLYVSPRGQILHHVQLPAAVERFFKYGGPKDRITKDHWVGSVEKSYVAVWDPDGKLLTTNAVGNTQNGHGVAMDRDGNIYVAFGALVPAGQKTLYGGVVPIEGHFDGGSLIKFPAGRPYPLGRSFVKGEQIPDSAVKVVGWGPVQAVDGAEWIWGGLNHQSPGPCTCHNVRYDMDYFARHWLPANQLYSVLVLDSNANLVARIGRYGNVDDSEADLKANRDGVRVALMRALAVSDKALYIADVGNARILKAALSYHAEATVPVP